MAIVDQASTYWTSAKVAPGSKVATNDISADTFRQMIDVLEEIVTHNHTMADQYTTVCQCQCDCSCGKNPLLCLDEALNDIVDTVF